MGVNTRRPPLPVPTETGSSMDDTSAFDTGTETNVTARTDKTHYSVPEDGSPITISTQKITSREGGSLGRHGRQKSQTSLLIEYFEAGKTGDKSRSRPSVRVKVTPSTRKSRTGDGAVQITGIGKDKKPSYTRRISLGGRTADSLEAPQATELSHSTGSNVSGHLPIEVEIQNGSDISSYDRSSRPLSYLPMESNVSSMPPDSLLEGGDSLINQSASRAIDQSEQMSVLGEQDEEDLSLKVPRKQRSRSLSKERLAQKVVEKIQQDSGVPFKTTNMSHHERSHSSDDYRSNERRRRTSRDIPTGGDSSLLSSNPNGSNLSYRSDRSQTSRMTNNPKLLEMVEDTIKRMILPEINQIKRERSVKEQSFDHESGNLGRSLSKHSSSPNIKSKPKVVLNRDGDDPGTILSRGDSEYKKSQRSGREQSNRPSSRRSSSKLSIQESVEDEEIRHKSSKSNHKLRDTAAAGVAGGILTAAALKHHDSQSEGHSRRRRKSSKSHGSRSRSGSIAETTDEAYGYEKEERQASHSRGLRSRSASLAKSMDEQYAYERKEKVPPMPMASAINESEITRQSILSSVTDRPSSRANSADLRTPIREVSRGSLAETMSPVSSRTPTRNSDSKGLGMSHANQSIDSPSQASTGTRKVASATAELEAARGINHEHNKQIEADGYGPVSPMSPMSPTRRGADSPAQSVASLRKGFESDVGLVPSGLRPHSAASRSSASQSHMKQRSLSSIQSGASSPRTKLARSRKPSEDEYVTPAQERGISFSRDGTQTPNDESVDEYYERQHRLNERYRDSMEETTNRDSYQTNPYPEDDKRYTTFTEESQDYREVADDDAEHNLRDIALNPQYVHRSLGVESNVASLMDPSMLTASTQMSSSVDSASRVNGTYSERMAERQSKVSNDDSPIYEGSSVSQNMPSENRWAAIKGAAKSLSNSQSDVGLVQSPRQSPARSLQREVSIEDQRSPIKLSSSGLPDLNDPMPEIGHYDDSKSDVTTNPSRGPSIVHGHLGGDDAGKNAWPYTPSPVQEDRHRLSAKSSRSLKSGHSFDAAGLGAAAGGAAAALATQHALKQARVEDDYDDGKVTPTGERHGDIYIDREATPTGSPAAFRDEGYVTNDGRSAGALTPKAEQVQFSRHQVEEFNRAMEAQNLDSEDPFVGKAKPPMHARGNSHGMDTAMYDSATGQGIDQIESKDIVHLMDHLTVRDAQRNARDTEILVTLVRTATEMQRSFDEMRRFIAEQDRMIMRNTDRDAEQTVQKVLNGPRPQPMSPRDRTPRQQSQEDIQKKRKGVFRRALNGLTGSKSVTDISKIEEMCMQILDEVEDLKHQGVGGGQRGMSAGSFDNESLDSYEKLRAGPDSGYEPEGQAGTSSSASLSAHFPVPASKQQFHSGYNGRAGSTNRVSTVLEGSDEDDSHLEPHEANLLKNQPALSMDRDRYPSPVQDGRRSYKDSPQGTPPRFAAAGLHGSPARGTPPYANAAAADDTHVKSNEKQRKHKSNSSSIFGGQPKVSRWSRTTASSGAPDPAAVESPTMARQQRPASQASHSTNGEYDDQTYRISEDDRLRSMQSLAREQEHGVHADETRSIRSQVSKLTRTSSPLIPSEASYRGDQYPNEDRQQIGSPIQNDDDEDRASFEDPKYRATRNSLLLQHPQPRQGPTERHQNTLESQAHMFGDKNGPPTDSDLSQRTVSDFDPAMWGSSGTAALSRNRMSQAEPLTPNSMGSGSRHTAARGSESLIPQKPAPAPQATVGASPSSAHQTRYDDDELDDEEDDDESYDDEDWEPDYSHSGYAKNLPPMDYSSPYGSGHLLEPIEEVRYSLETDSGHISLPPTQRLVGGSRRRNKNDYGHGGIDREMSPEPTSVQPGNGGSKRSPARKITGPRPMGSKSPAPLSTSGGGGTVRRKPAARSYESFNSDNY